MGGRAKAAERYPPRLVSAILRALRASMIDAGCGPSDGLLEGEWTLGAVETGTVLEEPEVWSRPAESEEEQVVRDQATGLPLDLGLVRAAREEEWAYMAELEMLKPSTMDECLSGTGRRPIPRRWVDIDKGDVNAPKVRSRLVCQETKRRSTIGVEDWSAVFAATPQYEASRFQLSLAMTGVRSGDAAEDLVLSLYDISRAHLHSPLLRTVLVEIDGVVYRLLKAMYGLRDAGASFDKKVTLTLSDLGFDEGTFCPCLATNATRVQGDGTSGGKPTSLVRLTRHGDEPRHEERQ